MQPAALSSERLSEILLSQGSVPRIIQNSLQVAEQIVRRKTHQDSIGSRRLSWNVSLVAFNHMQHRAPSMIPAGTSTAKTTWCQARKTWNKRIGDVSCLVDAGFGAVIVGRWLQLVA